MRNTVKIFKNKVFKSIGLFVVLLILFYIALNFLNNRTKYDLDIIIVEGEYNESNIS